jgi:NAD(P)-dependent dehydrogenase (short-subunit alcohol dehydrogenase family)
VEWTKRQYAKCPRRTLPVAVVVATSGLGLAAAEGFARLGTTVWLVVRSEDRGTWARDASTSGYVI